MTVKRVFDFTASLTALLVLSPLLLLIALLVKLDSPGPVFFTQQRVGLGGKPFIIFKFRTMQNRPVDRELQITIGRDPRITRLGHFLRATKLDELPQLFNVLIGEMSIVGPRPEVPAYMKFYTRTQRETILSVRPGITDFAAIEFSEESEILGQADDPEATYIKDVMPRKAELYTRYVQERSMPLDLWLIMRTLFKLTGR